MNATLPSSPSHNGLGPRAPRILGRILPDQHSATNEHVVLGAPAANRAEVLRNRFVRIEEEGEHAVRFLGRIVAGPYFPDGQEEGAEILARIEVQAELAGDGPRETSDRPAPGAQVVALQPEEIRNLLGCDGDMHLGHLVGSGNLAVGLRSTSKDVLPRNLGIFGTVGSGKSNTAQVVIEEAARNGWAVVVLDVEGEYVGMDQPSLEASLFDGLPTFDRSPQGLEDFRVLHPASCSSSSPASQAFTLRLADFDTTVVAELIEATLPERNALLDCVDYFESKGRNKMSTSETERLLGLLDPSPTAQLPYTITLLRDRARDRSPRSNEIFDYLGLATKLAWLLHSGAFDQPSMRALDPAEMLQKGRVTILDVSIANDTVKNLATADLLRKTFAYKIAKPEAPPTLLVIEEAHSFISREKVHTMQATLQMLRNVTRRGRKRWLAAAFVSQQPGHLPPEIFELCNTRIVHTLRSLHNLEALISTTSDVTREMWNRCPLLGTGEAVISSPQLKRPVITRIRPACSRRLFVH